jgi:hypothetical protein
MQPGEPRIMSSALTPPAALIIWTAFGLAAGLALLLLYLGLLHDRSRGRPRWPNCRYNMAGAPSLVCPECGHNARSTSRF